VRHISLFLIFILSIYISGVTWAASCERCYEKIADDKQLCAECELSTSNKITDMKFREVQIANVITSARENYKNALEELIQYYMNIGNHLRLERARKELKALNKVPQRKYLSAKEIIIENSPSKNIEEANILFQDGKVYINSLSIINKKSKLKSAETRFKKIVDEYPESDKADDAAYELASIYEGAYFKDYENAAFYYVKCYSLNASTDTPARFKAAWIYDKHLKNYKEAVINYRKVLNNSIDEADRYRAKTRLMQLNKKGY
jgi:TolA-binding protein